MNKNKSFLFESLILKLSSLVLSILILFYLLTVNYIEPNEVGITRNLFTGELVLQDRAGFYFTAPYVIETTIDTRPARVCFTSASRGRNCKLVQFNPEFYREFVEIEGFYYYWWANRISFNFGYDEEYRGMRDLLRGHTFGVVRYPFIKEITEYEE